MQLARVGDIATGICRAHDKPISVTGVISSGSNVVFIDDKPGVRVCDIVTFSCGHTGVVASGSSVSTIEGRGVGRVGDSVIGPMIATIVSGSPKSDTI